jgi:formylglycine-generating enzyme required for sulfatase activity
VASTLSLELTKPLDGAWLRRVALVGRVRGNVPFAGVQLRVGEVTISLKDDGSFRHSLVLRDGAHTLDLRATGGGKTARVRRQVYVDRTPPSLVVRSPKQGGRVRAARVLLELEVGDAAPWVDVRVGLTKPRRVKRGETLSTWVSLPRIGPHRILLQGKDSAGNASKIAELRVVRAAASGYELLVDRARKLSGFRYLDTKRYTSGGKAHEIARFRHTRTGLVFCLIPGGSFQMGSPSDEDGRQRVEGPQHRVKIAPFLLCQTETTQRAWQAITKKNPAGFRGPSLPVENVSWDDVSSFLKSTRLRLPSEAEWEYSCRAGTTTPFTYGKRLSSRKQANYDGEYPYGGGAESLDRERSSKVGALQSNAFGLYDVHGNVSEWCQDLMHRSYRGAPTDGRAWVERVRSSYRVCRGGSWYDRAKNTRSARRESHSSSFTSDKIGFRPARSLGRP